MIDYTTLQNKRERGSLDGQFLIAMPGMVDANFIRSVVYICAHSQEGAMGFIINKPQNLSFANMLVHLQLITDERELPLDQRQITIQEGGPMEAGRGFVLHSDDYLSHSSIPLTDDISLTSTIDIVRAIHHGSGPKKAALMLGYAGWGAGQLEWEIANNGWLNCPADEALIFDDQLESKYQRALGLMGIHPAMLSPHVGHA